MQHRRTGAVLIGLLLLLVGAPARAHEANVSHWDQQIVVVRDETGSADLRAALEHAIAAWNEATPRLQLQVEPGTGTGCRGGAREVQVCLTRSDRYAGSAQTERNGAHIRGAVVLIDAVRSGSHLRAVVCHELGHALGLDHRSDGETCMRPAPVVASPDDIDLEQVRIAHQPDCANRSLLTHNGRCVLVLP